MTEKTKNVVLRIISAVVALPVVLCLVYVGGIYFALLLGFAAAVGTSEYYRMTGGKITPAGVAGIVGAFCMPLFPVALPQDAGDLCFWWVGGFFGFFFVYHLFRDTKDAPTKVAHHTVGMIYAATGMVALAFVRIRPDGAWWCVVAMVITFGNDSFAFFVGRSFGRHKMYPQISPNKSWEGFFGGLAGSVGGLFILRAWLFPSLSVQDCLILGVLGSVIGPAGDFCESMLKRSCGVKDSGRLMPGHGGVLDRVDALLFNGPLVFVYLQFARGFVH